MIRAILYLAAAGAIWLAEGIVFAVMLRFVPWQVAAMVSVYAALFAGAVVYLARIRKTSDGDTGPARWRYLSLAPMLAVTLGSFGALPIILLIVILGKIV
jgi:hypothetical protein